MLTMIKKWWYQEEVCTVNPGLELAVTKLMVGMMSMDGKVGVEEQDEIVHLLNVRFGFSTQECKDMVSQAMDEGRTDVSFSKAVKQVCEHYTLQDRKSILAHVWSVALADGEVDFVEERYIDRLSGLIGVSTQDLNQIKFEQEKHIPNLVEGNRYQNPNLPS